MDDNDGPKKQSSHSSNSAGLNDDSDVKLANQEEEDKLVSTVDTLHSRKHRRKANLAHDKYELRKKLVSLKSQRNLLDRARAANIFQKESSGSQIQIQSPECPTKPEVLRVTFADQVETKDILHDEEPRSESLSQNKPSNGLTSASTPEPTSHKAPLDRPRSNSIPPDNSAKTNKITPKRENAKSPMPSRGTHPHQVVDRQRSYSIPTDKSTNFDMRKNLTVPQSGSRNRTRNIKIRPRGQNYSNDIVIEDLELEKEELIDFRWKTKRPQSERPSSTQLPAMQPHRTARPRATSALTPRGRSRRELYHLTHIDPITAADMALRRKLWFSQLEQNREIEEAQMKCKIKDFIAKVEEDKKKLRRTTGMDPLFGSESLLKN